MRCMIFPSISVSIRTISGAKYAVRSQVEAAIPVLKMDVAVNAGAPKQSYIVHHVVSRLLPRWWRN